MINMLKTDIGSSGSSSSEHINMIGRVGTPKTAGQQSELIIHSSSTGVQFLAATGAEAPLAGGHAAKAPSDGSTAEVQPEAGAEAVQLGGTTAEAGVLLTLLAGSSTAETGALTTTSSASTEAAALGLPAGGNAARAGVVALTSSAGSTAAGERGVGALGSRPAGTGSRSFACAC